MENFRETLDEIGNPEYHGYYVAVLINVTVRKMGSKSLLPKPSAFLV
jgi:hypothetical protein